MATLKTEGWELIDEVIGEQTDSVVDVTVNGQTCNGLRDTITNTSEPTAYTDQGVVSGIVRVKASDIDEPSKGSTIYVDDNLVFVTMVTADSARAVLTIHYQNQRPVELQ